MRIHRKRRTGAAATAAVATIALAAGLTVPASAAPTPGPSGAGQRNQTARQGLTHLTLITGDRVTVDAAGRPVGFRPAPGREKTPVSVERSGDRTSLVPADAQRLIDTGRLDPRLFDITELGRAASRGARGDRLKLIVRYEAGAAPAAKSALRAAGGLQVDRTYAFLDAEAVSASPDRAAAVWTALTGAQARGAAPTTTPGIATVWLDGVRTADLDKSTRQIGADQAWNAGYDGTGVKIAVLDTGVDAGHPDLAGQIVSEQNFSSAADAKDRHGHGTHVASIAAGTGAKSGGAFKGVAPGAKVLSGKVLDDHGSGDDSGILAGIEWAAAQGAHVVNLSLGGADTPGIDPLEAAVNKLSADRGVLFAIAAGNSGRSGRGSISSPGSADAALTVGAVNDDDAIADFSSVGPRIGDGAIKPDVTAPGVDITAAAADGSALGGQGQNPDGYITLSGTSMAAPHAAGAAALLKQQHPQWTGTELKGVLAGSAKPRRGGAYEQGGGRIAVDNALRLELVAEPGSLVFAGRQWPHDDDTPEKKQLAYRNLGTAPVTLELAATVTDPDDKPAPAGMVTFDAPRVTVPAGGTASVGVIVDTRLGTQVDGTYTAYVVATGPAGQSVRTAVAIEREAESYNLTLKHLGRDGKPATAYGSALRGLTAGAAGRRFAWSPASGQDTLRVPVGGYLLNTNILVDPNDFTRGIDWIAQPWLEVTGDGTVTLDARTTKPVDITVPSRTASMQFAMPLYTVVTEDSGHGFGWWLDSYTGLRTRQQGPDVPAGTTLFQQWDAHWTDGETEEYHATLGGPVTRLATGYKRQLKAAQLATVVVEQGASVPGKTGMVLAIGSLPGATGGSSLSRNRALPGTTKLHLSAVDGAKWAISTSQSGDVDENGFPRDETQYDTGAPRTFQAGRTYRERFNAGVFGPRVDTAAGLGLYRQGDELWGTLPLLADGAGHEGSDYFTKGRTVLYRNGVQVGSDDAELALASRFTVPAATGSYKLVTSTTRSDTVSRISSKVTATWWFRSKTTPADPEAPTSIPLSAVRFTPDLSLAGTSPAGRTVRVPVTVQGAAAKTLTVQVSYDDGYTWSTVPVRSGAVTVKNPAKGGNVSLRGTTTDGSGNKSEITIIRAWLAD
ncbi:S8 family serine peptidase [Streptomyces sp. NPDC059874]|uniref:S8 family peptidase n=1 Tax=Streptomyces sp. NPDC059874 TaxID=3346983 RepID=UPI0036542470